MKRALALLLALLISPSVASESDTALALLWTVQAAPPGNVGFLAADDLRVYHAVDGRLLARDPGTGRVLWLADSPALAHAPAVSNGTLVAARTDGLLLAHDAATGERAWTVELPNGTPRRAHAWSGLAVSDYGEWLEARDLDDGSLRWGPGVQSTAPSSHRRLVTATELLWDDGTAAYGHAMRSATIVTSRDSANGNVSWTRTLDEPPGLVALTPSVTFIAGGLGGMTGLNSSSGEILWQRLVGRPNPGWLAASRDRGFLVVPGNAQWFEFPAGRHGVVRDDAPLGDTHVLGIDAATGDLAWTYRGTASSYHSLLPVDGVLYAASSNYAGLLALDAETGRLLWKWSPAGTARGGFAALVASGDRLVALEGNGRLHALRVDASRLPPLRFAIDARESAGEALVTVNATNEGAAAGTFAVHLRVDAREVDVRLVDLAPGETVAVEFEPVPLGVGYHVVEAGPDAELMTAETSVAVHSQGPAPGEEGAVREEGDARGAGEDARRGEESPAAESAKKLPWPGAGGVLALALALAFKRSAKRDA